ncbi:YciI family protein [Paraburkholderia bryophila]|uniref:YciI family protein n=1 Tax=Paraburkholderia bryophila TaxID=420952 RepID=UPI00234A38C5|nr:YciI family protein [Paraburkholderia bryophila]WCM20227.1 YciI family protein [Paraburkholderia bryophila]
MYVINLSYIASLERVDDVLEAHRAFLTRQFEAGVFIAAGPKVPRDGGIILAVGVEREKLDAILASDPFAVQQIARYEVTEFKATRLAPGLNLPMPA